MKNLDSKEKKILTHTILFTIANTIVDLFFSFYIYDQTQDITVVLKYKFWQYLSIPVGAFISDLIINKVCKFRTYALGLIIMIVNVALIISLKESSINFVGLLGFASGFTIGTKALPWNMIFQQEIRNDRKGKFGGMNRTFRGIISIIIPSSAAFFISAGGSYNSLFIVSVVILTTSLIVIFGLRSKKQISSKMKLYKALKLIFKNNNVKQLFMSGIVNGLRSSITWSIWPIITLNIVGSMQNWGTFKIVFTLITVVFSFTIAKNFNMKSSRIGASLTAFLYFAASIILAVYYDFTSFIIFSIGLAMFDGIYWNSIDIIRSKAIDASLKDKDLLDELQLIREFAYTIGRMIPITLMLILGLNMDNSTMIRVIIAALGVVPIVIYKILSSTDTVKSYDLPTRDYPFDTSTF